MRQPAGTVTMLFSDVEGSTRLLERLGRDRYADALELHRRLLRHAFDQNNGYEVDSEGDAFFVAFGRAGDAVATAAEAQQALAAADWPDDAEVRVRMGIHTGEPLVVPPKYVGIDVHRAARIMAAAHGGQVLVSQTTRDLLAGDAGSSLATRDLGEHRLKDLSEPQRLYQLQLAGLTNDFPPPRTLENRPMNLPVQPTPLVGRERELEEVERLLVREDVRLVTLTGSGGAGNTRLALHAAADLIEHFPQGVWAVALAPVTDPELVVPTIAQTLGVRETGEEALQEMLAAYLRDREMLLVLDNFEQLVEAAPTVAALLQHAPKLKILVTSRAPVHVSGEREYAVPPLSVPERDDLVEAAALSQYESVALFIARAEAVTAGFVLTNDNAPAVAEICVRLDGLPLAIELAAARVRVLPPKPLLARLDHSLKLLTGGAKDLPTRQQTLQATIDWSYRLLSAEEQQLFAELSVFVGGWTLEAAEAVLGRDGAVDVLDGIASLVEKNLVRQREDVYGESRFSMLETIREYALERLRALPAADDLLRAHAEYVLEFALVAERELQGERQTDWLGRLDRENANLTAALTWSREHETTFEVRLVNALVRFWGLRGQLRTGQAWVEEALAREGVDLGSRIVTLRWATYFAGMLGDHARAQTVIREWLASARELGDARNVGEALYRLGEEQVETGDIAAGRATLEEALRIARELDDPDLTAKLLGILGIAAREERDHTSAADFFEQSSSLFRSVGNRFNLAITLQKLGMARLDSGRPAEAVAPLRESLAILCEFKNEFEISFLLEGFAVLIAGDDAESAVRLMGKADALRAPSNARLERSELHRIAKLLASTKSHIDAATWQRAWSDGQRMSLDDAIALTSEPHGAPVSM
jgi:predicted ATPase/class 3 adenylate cyclase